jgi:PncC family amidohydrolase
MKTEELHGADGPVSEAAVRGKYTELTLGLIRRGLTITTMESCTSGQIASLITDTEGSSAVLKGAFVTYSNEAKIMQGVPAAIIGTYGVYSAETAAAMAEACRAVYGADIGTGVTGSFGNADPANADSVPGEVYFAVATERGTETFHCTVPVQASRLAYKLYMADVIAERLALEIKI